jgi:DNA-binding protein HU-beta
MVTELQDRTRRASIWLRRLNSWFEAHIQSGGVPLALTQTQLIAAIADRAELSKADAKRALAALDDVVLEELGNAQKVRIDGLVQLTVRVKSAQKKRKGRNPSTGEEIEIAAKPASVDVRARPLARAKAALPSVQKARRRLAA